MMEAEPPEAKRTWLDRLIRVLGLSRPATGWTLYALGWGFWLASLPMPVGYIPSIGDPRVASPFTLPTLILVLATFGGFDLAEKMSVFLRILAAAYLLGLIGSLAFAWIGRGVGRATTVFRFGTMGLLLAGPGFLTYDIGFQVASHYPVPFGVFFFLLAHVLVFLGVWLIPAAGPRSKGGGNSGQAWRASEKVWPRIQRWLWKL